MDDNPDGVATLPSPTGSSPPPENQEPGGWADPNSAARCCRDKSDRAGARRAGADNPNTGSAIARPCGSVGRAQEKADEPSPSLPQVKEMLRSFSAIPQAERFLRPCAHPRFFIYSWASCSSSRKSSSICHSLRAMLVDPSTTLLAEEICVLINGSQGVSFVQA